MKRIKPLILSILLVLLTTTGLVPISVNAQNSCTITASSDQIGVGETITLTVSGASQGGSLITASSAYYIESQPGGSQIDVNLTNGSGTIDLDYDFFSTKGEAVDLKLWNWKAPLPSDLICDGPEIDVLTQAGTVNGCNISISDDVIYPGETTTITVSNITVNGELITSNNAGGTGGDYYFEFAPQNYKPPNVEVVDGNLVYELHHDDIPYKNVILTIDFKHWLNQLGNNGETLCGGIAIRALMSEEDFDEEQDKLACGAICFTDDRNTCIYCPNECPYPNKVKDEVQDTVWHVCGNKLPCGDRHEVCCPNSSSDYKCDFGNNCVDLNVNDDDLDAGFVRRCSQRCGAEGQICCRDSETQCENETDFFCNTEENSQGICEEYPADSCVFSPGTGTVKKADGGYQLCVRLNIAYLRPGNNYWFYLNSWRNPLAEGIQGAPTITSDNIGNDPMEFCADFHQGSRGLGNYSIWIGPENNYNQGEAVCEAGLFFNPDAEAGESEHAFYINNDGLHAPCIVSGSDILDRGKYIATALGCIPITASGIAASVAGFGIGVAGGIALILLAYASIVMITSQGDPKRLQSAREIFTSALIGLILIILSAAVLRIMGVSVLGLF